MLHYTVYIYHYYEHMYMYMHILIFYSSLDLRMAADVMMPPVTVMVSHATYYYRNLLR